MKFIFSQLLIVSILPLLSIIETNGQDIKSTSLKPICVKKNYKPKSESKLAAMTPRQLIDEQVKAELMHDEVFDEYREYSDYTDLVRKYARKAGIKLLPVLTEYMNAYAPKKDKNHSEYDPMSASECNSERFSVSKNTANDIDRFDFRLRATKEGQAAIQALEQAIQRMKEADLDKEANYIESSLWALRDQKGSNEADRAIQDTFRVLYKIEMYDKELLEFSNFLITVDPSYPSWSNTSWIKVYSRINEAGNPSQVITLNKPERYYEAYLEFKKRVS